MRFLYEEMTYIDQTIIDSGGGSIGKNAAVWWIVFTRRPLNAPA
jgi:hypothetical protein